MRRETVKETWKNLVKAFIGESIARNKYTFYAKKAKEEGYVFLNKVFLETAENEKEHAENLIELIKQLGIGKLELNIDLEIVFGSTVENLKSSIEGEKFENEVMYPKFAEVAEIEGYEEIAKKLRSIAVSEKHHEERFRILLERIENGSFFKRDKEVEWICLECGYVHVDKEPPALCPSCGHPSSYYVSWGMLSL